MSARVCAAPGCGKALVRREGERADKFRDRRSCNTSCGGQAGRSTKHWDCRPKVPRAPVEPLPFVPWPRVTGDIDWNGAFATQNMVVDDGGMFRMMRPATHVEGGGG